MMTDDNTRIRQCIQNFQFKDLFIDELGWDNYNDLLEINIEGDYIKLRGIAEKRGLVVFKVAMIPEQKLRRKIERNVSKHHRENIIIYVDTDETQQIWQWVRREHGKPLANREHRFSKGQSGHSLALILGQIAFSFAEEDHLTLVTVSERTRAAFDVERVTRRFYELFKTQHDAFLKFIEGIPDEEFQRWYASVMLNRIMFIYFVQSKCFLDNDLSYLKNRLAQSTDNFYRDFLCPLFFEGFAKKDHPPHVRQLLGDVPYLNGGLFLKHQIEEQYGEAIHIDNQAFDKLFDFLDAYQWHLDDRPLHNDNEINPDVLGYIFEKYINQKQMGAYYTKEDITEYISKNAIIPFLFDEARKEVHIAFEGDYNIWGLLSDDPDRYIYSAVKKGTELPLPNHIALGIEDVSQRTAWNTPTSPEYGLPTEIWRETVARRTRYEEIKAKLEQGEVRQINDLITLNLDIQQFAQDVIGYTDSPDVIRAIWKALNKITVLDPTCGSGAFLFAALNILEPLYEACLGRMELFLADHPQNNRHPQQYSDFREVMERINQHPNRDYFILKSIIINNLFGVDIMDEAIEIAKLRLFLKLMSHVDDKNKIEPLPDIDFNIRSGNTLVGFATKAEIEGNLFAQTVLRRLETITGTLDTFRREQIEGNISPEQMQTLKSNISKTINEISATLDEALAPMHGFGTDQVTKFKQTHRPFHWFSEFYGVLSEGGFDVIIGNPPYVEYSQARKEYTILGYLLIQTGNLYSICMERFLNLARQMGLVSVIIPISSVSTPRMKSLMEVITHKLSPLYISNFAVRPDKLFTGVDMNLTIISGKKQNNSVSDAIFSTRYNRWYSSNRSSLFETLSYYPSTYLETSDSVSIPKIGHLVESSILQKTLAYQNVSYLQSSSDGAEIIYYHSGGRYFRKAIKQKLSNEYKALKLQKGWGDPLICLLSSSLYYLIWIITSDTYHVTKGDIYSLTVPASLKDDPAIPILAEQLLDDLWEKAAVRLRNRADNTQREEVNFKIGKSKHIIDEIDRVLARHYGFTDEELDFIINYDIKYRMGDDLGGDEGEK